MNSYERVIAVLEGRKPDVTPVIPWVREWCSVQAGVNFVAEIESAEKHVASQSYCVDRFGYDCVWDLLGMSAESEAMGSELKIAEGRVPTIVKHVIEDYDRDMPGLRIFDDPYRNRRLSVILNGTEQLKAKYSGRVPVISYIQGPLRHVCMLRGTEKVMMDMYKRKDGLRHLSEIALESLLVYAEAEIRAGADIICIGDPVSSSDIISRKMWEEWGFPYTKKLTEHIKLSRVKVMLHVCGNTTDRLDSLAATGADILSLDEAVDFAEARRLLGPEACLMGNVSTTVLATGSPEDVRDEVREVIKKAGAGGRLIVSGGCLIGETCPAENMQAMVDTAREFTIS